MYHILSYKGVSMRSMQGLQVLFICIIHMLISMTFVHAKAPNIVILLLDDIGKTDIGYSSISKTIPTPFINKLASHEGAVRLDKYYTQSLCTPTRAALLTGRYAYNGKLLSISDFIIYITSIV